MMAYGMKKAKTKAKSGSKKKASSGKKYNPVMAGSAKRKK